MIKFISELKKEDLNGKKTMLRVDFDVPAVGGKIVESFRIAAHRETINYLLGNGAKVALVSHISTTGSFEQLVGQISLILGREFAFAPFSEHQSLPEKLATEDLILLDNIRQDPREVKNDDGLARSLARGFDYYVDDAFAVAHRDHASVSAITKFLPSYGGLLLKNEIENLFRAINLPKAGKVLVIGGAKISTKLPVIKNFLVKAEKILIGGALANNFFKFKGIEVGRSLVDNESLGALSELDLNAPELVLPQDAFVATDRSGAGQINASEIKNLSVDEIMVDIGPKTAEDFCRIIKNSLTVIWNGPMGLSEVDLFSNGTRAVAQAVVGVKNSIIGGGDTITALERFGLLANAGYVSTGGGAMLKFLAGDKLPGLEALGCYE